MILFNDFSKEVDFLRMEIDGAIQRVLNSGWFILGKEVESFEQNFARYIGSRYCVGVASGTEAIALSLMAYDIGKNDEVITTNLTAFPTITGIFQSGAKPVVVDIFLSNGLMDYRQIQAKITRHTRAIIPVHLYGQSCNLGAIKEVAAKNNLIVIEDCAQSTGATFKGQNCGAIGDCGAFSFYPTKNLGAYGDGGAVTTSDEEIYTRLLSLRNYGQTKRYYHDTMGINSRLDEIQAAILNVKLKYLDNWNRQRREIARIYREGLCTVECLTEEDYGTPAYHLFVIKSDQRNALHDFLRNKGIQTYIHYPVPVSKQKAFLWQKNDKLKNSDIFADVILSLPIYPGLPKQYADQIIQTINDFSAS